MNNLPIVIAESDFNGFIVLIVIVVVIAAVIKSASKPKGKWVYVEQKKGCLITLVVFILTVVTISVMLAR